MLCGILGKSVEGMQLSWDSDQLLFIIPASWTMVEAPSTILDHEVILKISATGLKNWE